MDTPRLTLGPRSWLFILGTLLLRIPSMGKSLWFDEIYRTSVHMNPERALVTLLGDVHNPLYNSFMYLWIRLVGESGWALRLPSLVAAYLSVFFFCRWLARIVSPRLARWTGAWLLVAPAHLWYSTDAKNNAFTVLFSVLALVAWWRLVEEGTRRALVRAGLATAVAILCDFATLIMILPAMACALIDRRGQALGVRLRSAGMGLVIALGTTAPLLVYKAANLDSLNRSYVRHFDLRELFLLFANYFPTGNAILPYPPTSPEHAFEGVRLALYACTGGLCLGLLALGLVASRSASRSSAPQPSASLKTPRAPGTQAIWLALPLLLPLAGLFLASFVLHNVWFDRGRYMYQERNMLVLLYPFAASLFSGALSLHAALVRRTALTLLMSLPLIASALLLGPRANEWTVYKPAPDWRAAAVWLQVNLATDTHPIILECAPGAALGHYAPHLRRVRLSSWPPPARQLDELAASLGVEEFTLISNDYWHPVVPELLQDTAPSWRMEHLLELRSLQIYRLWAVE
ncbi:MAG: glycosyltransferase family 39 protein [bacterium]|nr:glycosyltransferase family 39 protein [Planctomycetota bacterium]HIL51000.1 glycosyltransferase family 39 protein [Planctomycetota bacterium]